MKPKPKICKFNFYGIRIYKFVKTFIVPSMKRGFLLSLLMVCISIISAHDVNKYKYFCLDVTDNPYGIEKRFIKEFGKFGFVVIDKKSYEALNPQEKSLVLFADYNYNIVYNGYSPLTLTLRTIGGKIVWTETGTGGALTAGGDMRSASKKILQAFSRLDYKFDATLSEPTMMEHPFIQWNEDSVRHYLTNSRIAPIEGIYKNYSNNGNGYTVAILKNDSKYYGIILQADNGLFSQGEIKMMLNPIERNVWDVDYFNADHKKVSALAKLENRVLGMNAPGAGGYGRDVEISFIKTFPSSDNNTPRAVVSNECKATGSGVLISDNIIITNYHVIEDSEKVEAIVNVDGMPETFSARVLCTDKTNDLAIVCIKDEKFKNKGEAPFKVLQNTVEVGTSVFAMGFPLTSFMGEEVKVTDGIISSKSGYDGDITTYQISAPIQPGNSGGPLFDKNGNLVGITNAGINKSVAENVGYAIKSPYIYSIVDSAPISIHIPQTSRLTGEELPQLIKALKPFVVYIKVY